MDIRQVAVALGVVETVADDEHVLDLRSEEGDVDVDLPARRFREQRHDLDRPWVPRLEQLEHVGQGRPGVHDVLHQVDVTVSDVDGDVLDQDHRSGRCGARAVAGHLDEVDLERMTDVSRQVGQEVDTALEHADEDRRPAIQIGSRSRAANRARSPESVAVEHLSPQHPLFLSLSNFAITLYP